MRSAVESNLTRWNVTEARIANLTIDVNPDAVPAIANVDLIGRVSVDDPQNSTPYRNAVRRFTIQLRRDGDTWQMTSYGEHEIKNAF